MLSPSGMHQSCRVDFATASGSKPDSKRRQAQAGCHAIKSLTVPLTWVTKVGTATYTIQESRCRPQPNAHCYRAADRQPQRCVGTAGWGATLAQGWDFSGCMLQEEGSETAACSCQGRGCCSSVPVRQGWRSPPMPCSCQGWGCCTYDTGWRGAAGGERAATQGRGATRTPVVPAGPAPWGYAGLAATAAAWLQGRRHRYAGELLRPCQQGA